MKLLTKEVLKNLVPFGTTAGCEEKDITCKVKFFSPDSNYTFYAIEYDPTRRVFYGYGVFGYDGEWGEVSLTELETAKGNLGLPLERDRYFEPTKMSDIVSKY